MADTALLPSLLLLLLVVHRGGAICTSTSYTNYPGYTVSGGQISGINTPDNTIGCLLECNTISTCYGYLFDSYASSGYKCRFIFFYFDDGDLIPSGNPYETLHRRDCDTPPTTTTRRPPTTPTACPPTDGLSTGMVVLIAVFTAIGGMILGMLLTVKCCPIGKGNWFSTGDHPAHCLCKKCSTPTPPGGHSSTNPSCTSCPKMAPPSCTSCHPPQHPNLLPNVKAGPIVPALPPNTGCVRPGQTFSVAASPYNDVYTVSLSGN